MDLVVVMLFELRVVEVVEMDLFVKNLMQHLNFFAVLVVVVEQLNLFVAEVVVQEMDLFVEVHCI
jgi:hypothetical protein